MAEETLLSVNNLKTYFIRGQRIAKAVDGIHLQVKRGKVLCIVGESGSGKSLTALSIMRLTPEGAQIVDGEITLDGANLLSLSERDMKDIRGNQIGMIFQEPMTAFNPVLKIGRQIGEVLVRHRRLSFSEAKLKAIGLLRSVGIPRPEQVVNEYPHQLSGGMRQRAMIAMAMACEPKLLIADEPTTALDVTIQAQVLALMQEMREKVGTAIILVTHDLGVVAQIADDVVVMYGGQVVESASADALFGAPMHPYTRALMNSIPTTDNEQRRLNAIPGSVPDSAEFPPGCRFADRCSMAQSSCREAMPELKSVSPGHLVRCDLVE